MSWIKTQDLRNSVVTEAKLATGAISAGKLATGAVTADKIGASAVTETKIQTAAVSLSKAKSNLAAETITTVTNAEMLNLRATPKTVVPAQGANTVVVVESVILDATPSGGAYTETADNLTLKYKDGSGAACSGDLETTGVIDGTVRQLSLAPGIAAGAIYTTAVNQPVVLHNSGDGEFGGGNAANVIRVIVRYHVVTI